MKSSVGSTRQSGIGVPSYIGYLLVALGVAVLVQVSLVNGRIALFGEAADGEVVALERSARPRGQTTPVVRFSTKRGDVVVFRGFSQYRSPYSVGERKRVRYVEGQPALAEIDSWPTLWRALVLASSLGIGLIAGGAAIIRGRRSAEVFNCKEGEAEGQRRMAIRVVQLGSPRSPGEGVRLGTVRRPPRGIPKAKYASRNFYDVWLPDLAPSKALVKVALRATEGRAWQAFVKRYRAEMKRPPATRLLALLAALSHHTTFSIGCYCADEGRCHRSILRTLLLEHGARFE
jgi:uncharacterized protein YeaO (DUF488 family)